MVDNKKVLRFLERLYLQLDTAGLAESTYVVIVGDHGEVCHLSTCTKFTRMPLATL